MWSWISEEGGGYIREMELGTVITFIKTCILDNRYIDNVAENEGSRAPSELWGLSMFQGIKSEGTFRPMFISCDEVRSHDLPARQHPASLLNLHIHPLYSPLVERGRSLYRPRKFFIAEHSACVHDRN